MLIVGEENVVSALEELVLRGFCFHGSSRLVEKLIPPGGSDGAVYLTTNPLMAMFAALTVGADVGKSMSKSVMEVKNEEITYPGKSFFAVEKPENIASAGYIYVVDRKTAGPEEVNGEILTHEPVEPMLAIKIKKEEFKYKIEKLS